MKIRNCKILSAGILLVFTIGTTACNSGNGEQVYFHNSDAFIENHTSGILDYESISYEEYAALAGHRAAILFTRNIKWLRRDEEWIENSAILDYL